MVTETIEDSAAIFEAPEPVKSQKDTSNEVLEEAGDVQMPALEADLRAVEPIKASEPQLTTDCQAEAIADQKCCAVVEGSSAVEEQGNSSPEKFDLALAEVKDHPETVSDYQPVATEQHDASECPAE